jgi:bifunctional DNA-binding transcriptional regulator/antitoxin component of YhaV-PrlF toxin-antitoxin module
MESRKVIRNKKSYYINIPLEISKALGIVKGDRLKIIHLPGNGILITLDKGAGKVSVNLQSIDRLQRAADAIYSQLEGRVKDLGLNFISNLQARIVSDLAVSGLLDLKARVEKIETKQEVSNQRRAKIHLLKKPNPNNP